MNHSKFLKETNNNQLPPLIFKKLLLKYQEPHRKYHNLTHLKECFEEFEKIKASLRNPSAVKLAIWYHDAIYNPEKQDNEKKSSQFFLKDAKILRLSEILKKEVSRLILKTKHQLPPTKTDEKLLLDIDLSILGKPEKRFKEYENQIREEYYFLEKREFNQKRSSFLKSLLKRKNIYSTEFFKTKYEKKARENIKNLVGNLS